MGLTIQITQEKGSIEELSKQMRRRAFHLQESMESNVFFTSWFIGRAAHAATRLAPKTYPIVANPDKTQVMKPYAAKHVKDGKVTLVPIWGLTKPIARLNPAAQIKKHGLAKQAWFWCLRDLRDPSGKVQAQDNPNLRKVSRSAATIFRYVRDKTKPSVTFGLGLKYATSAFKIKGRQTENDIARRAANSMRKDLERRIKAMK